MERSVQLIVVGGLCLVAGLWALTLAEWRSVLWLASVGIVVTGVLALGLGIAREVTAGPLERF